VIAHEGLNRALDSYRPAQGTPERAKATFVSRRTVSLDKVSAEAVYLGPAHTGADASCSSLTCV
jgi:hypothetical protein